MNIYFQIEFSRPIMKISIANDQDTGNCIVTHAGDISGDYLLIPGGMYIETSATTGLPNTYMNDQFCGTGLGNTDSVVSVNLPGPVTVRSEKCSS